MRHIGDQEWDLQKIHVVKMLWIESGKLHASEVLLELKATKNATITHTVSDRFWGTSETSTGLN